MEVMSQHIGCSERTLLVVPMHRKAYDTIPHPADAIRRKFPLAYGHLRGKIQRGEVEGGYIVVTDTREGKIICWMIVHTQDGRGFNLEWIESAIKSISAANLHQKYDMGFPVLGCYREDGVDPEDVVELIRQNLDGPQHLCLYLNY